MSLYQGSGFWGGKQYQDLTELHLPSPAVVIDVRWGNDHDPPLIWNLAIELEDLSTEMKLNQVYRWRHLIDCIDLLKLSPMKSDASPVERTDFVLTTRTGQIKSLHGARQLIEELGREHLDRVRNNRVGASRDRSRDTMNQRLGLGDPEQSTVRVFFLADAEDTDSLVSAATYAKWLKQWYHEYEDAGRSGRDKRVSALAICMNADPHRHHPHYLAKYLSQEQGPRWALDTVILLHKYGNDEAYIGGDIQSYQVELILYALLLRSLESLIESDQEMVDVQTLSSYVYSGALQNQPVIPWTIYMMGISSLEYSARWGSRWLDYGLVAKITHLMRESGDVDRESELGLLQKNVQEAMRNWLQEVRELIPAFAAIIPELQVLDDLERYLASSPFKGKRSSSLTQDLNVFIDNILQLYRGHGQTLESSIQHAHLIPWQIKSDYMQTSLDTLGESSLESDLYQRLLALQAEAVHLPASRLHRARGMLNRSLQQIAELNKAIAEIHETAENPPNLEECYSQFKKQAEQELAHLQRTANTQRWPLGDKLLQQSKESARKLSTIARSHLDQVRAAITARVALTLLQEVGLYNPEGKLCLYHRRLKLLDEAMKKAERQALLQHQRAYERLNVSLSQRQLGISQSTTWLSLNSRKDLLNWVQLVEFFEQLSNNLETEPTSLNMLISCLLLLMGGEKPMIIAQQFLGKLKEEQQQFFKTNEFEKMRLHVLSTVLVAILLLFDIVNPDIAAIEPLLDTYFDLRDRSTDEPSLLENNFFALQHIIREMKATHSNLLSKNNLHLLSNFALRQDQPLELILAAWVNNQYAGDPLLVQTLDDRGILVRLEENKIKSEETLDDLRERNRLLGYRDDMAGQDRFFLLLGPGEASDRFLTELNLQHSSQIRAARFPDPEKLIYLHIHRIRQVFPGFVSPPQEQLSPNT